MTLTNCAPPTAPPATVLVPSIENAPPVKPLPLPPVAVVCTPPLVVGHHPPWLQGAGLVLPGVLVSVVGSLPVFVVAAKTKLLDAAVAPPPTTVEPPTSLPTLFTVPAVKTPFAVPLHAAPVGQHATCPAASAEQTASEAQQRPGAPRLEQESKSFGQVLLNCRFSRSCDCAVSLLRVGGMKSCIPMGSDVKNGERLGRRNAVAAMVKRSVGGRSKVMSIIGSQRLEGLVDLCPVPGWSQYGMAEMALLLVICLCCIG